MSLSRMLLLCSLLLATVFALAAPAPTTGSSGSSAIAIQTYLQPDLSLKSVLSTGSLQLAGGPHLLRTCACSCGFPCTTDADCGPGGRCTAGITCCARDPKNSAWINTSASRKHPAPVFAAKCK